MLAAAAGGLVAALEDNPREPVLLNELGVLFYGLGDGRSADRLFTAAKRLDPTLPGVDANVAAARELAKVPRGRADRHAGAAAHARRPRRGDRAPGGALQHDAHLALHDREGRGGDAAALARRRRPVRRRDRRSSTPARPTARSRSRGASALSVVDFPWNGSFADARNVSLDPRPATGSSGSTPTRCSTRAADRCCASSASRSWREGFYLRMTSVLGDDDGRRPGFVHQTMRLFRNRPEYRFVGRIHEQHTGEMPLHIPERFEVTEVHVLHYGYGAERVAARDKGERNRSLLELDAAENDDDPFTLFNLGTEHLAAGRPDEAAEVLATAWVTVIDASRQAAAVPALAGHQVGAGAAARRRARSALAAAEQALAIYPDHTDIVREAALSARDNGELERAAAFTERASSSGTRLRGMRVRSAPARSSRLACSPRSARRSAATTRRRRCSSVRSPSTRPSRRPAAHSRKSRRCAPPTACSRRPLRQAWRSGCARRGEHAGVAAETLALHAGWRDGTPFRSSSRRPRSRRSTGCSSYGVRRLREPRVVWHSSPLPERDRRELLAGVYMARGFLDSAAEEWLAVAAAEPTAPALAGLARVAHARGLADDARVLLDEALRLDPSSEEGERYVTCSRRPRREIAARGSCNLFLESAKDFAGDADYGFDTTLSIHGRIVDDRSHLTQQSV